MIFRPERVDKPWGHELIWARTDGYVGKLLKVNAGESLSLQYHERKDETLHLMEGEIRFLYGRSRESVAPLTLRAGDSIHVPPGTIHRMEAVTDAVFLEVSTPELDDVVRLEDRYGRVEG